MRFCRDDASMAIRALVAAEPKASHAPRSGASRQEAVWAPSRHGLPSFASAIGLANWPARVYSQRRSAAPMRDAECWARGGGAR